jgi:hypothetical protein
VTMENKVQTGNLDGGRETCYLHSCVVSWKFAIVLSAVLRIAYSLCAGLMELAQPVHEQLMRSNALTEGLAAHGYGVHYLLLGTWERFDTLWYLHVAANGYDRPDAVVFFPLYPALIRVLSFAMPPMFAALTVSSLAAFFLFWGLQELLKPDYGEETARQAVVFCAVWPASFIFFSGYPESLLLALTVWSLHMAQANRWLEAIVLSAASVSTKAVGLAVLAPLMVIAFRNRRAMIAPLLLLSVVFVAVLEYVQHAAGETMSAAYRDFWRTTTAAPWNTVRAALSALFLDPNLILILNLLCLVLVCALAFSSRVRIEYLIYAGAVIAMVLCKRTEPPLQSMIRYMLIIFPAFVGLARITRASRHRRLFVTFCIGLFTVNLGLLWLFEGWSLVL